MAPPRISDEQAERAVSLVAKHGSMSKACRAEGIATSTMFRWMQRATERGLHGGIPEKLPPGLKLKGTSTLYRHTEEGTEEVLQWVKTSSEPSTEDLIAALKSTFDAYQGRAKLVPAPKLTDIDLLSVYPIADQHNGLMAWGAETGEDYDLKIGSERLRSCMSRLVAQSPSSRHALILNLGDWQHTDDAKNMTPRSGNILDVDSRYMKILTTGVQLMMDCIELALQKHEHVTVRNLPGNHDPHASVALTVALAAFYAKNPRVTVDDDPGDLFFLRFGTTLIGACHGHKMKPDRMALTMAVRRREDWGRTQFHYFYFGHIHHETLKEVGDVRCESFQTLAAKDAHAHSSGYNSGQSLTSITIHQCDGEVGRHRINIAPALRAVAT